MQPVHDPTGDPRRVPSGDIVGPTRASGPLLCPGCGESYGGDSAICVRCGIDLRSGEVLARDAGPGQEAEERPPWWAWFPALCPGFFQVKTLVVSLLALVLGAVCVGLCLLFLAMGVMFTAVSAGAVGVILYAQAVAMILTGEIALLNDALAEFDGSRWTAFFFALAIPFTVVIAFLFLHGGPPAGD